MPRPEDQRYAIHACRYCGSQVVWDRRGRHLNDFGWYCSNHRSHEHPDLFHGYCAGDEVELVEVVPRAASDALESALTEYRLQYGPSDESDAALAKYREAVG